MCTHQRVNASDRLSPSDRASGLGSVRLLEPTVNSFETVESFTKCRAEPVVGLYHIAEDGVSTSGRLVQDVEKGGSGWLLLICDIAVPSYSRGSRLEERRSTLVIMPTVY